MSNLEIANSLLDFLANVLRAETPMLKHYGVVNVKTLEEHKLISIWACKCDLGEEKILNPIERIEQLVLENNLLKQEIAKFKKQVQNE